MYPVWCMEYDIDPALIFMLSNTWNYILFSWFGMICYEPLTISLIVNVKEI